MGWLVSLVREWFSYSTDHGEHFDYLPNNSPWFRRHLKFRFCISAKLHSFPPRPIAFIGTYKCIHSWLCFYCFGQQLGLLTVKLLKDLAHKNGSGFALTYPIWIVAINTRNEVHRTYGATFPAHFKQYLLGGLQEIRKTKFKKVIHG